MDLQKKLPLKSWQNLFIKSDPSYGHLMASILQTISKNFYVSLLHLVKSIETNPSFLISGEGVLDLLPRYSDPLLIVPKYYISNLTLSFENEDDIIENLQYESLITIRCDFLITLNINKVTELPENFIKNINETLSIVRNNNKNILINFFLKLIKEGQYFIPQEFLEKSIYEEKIPKTKYVIKDIFQKFNLTESDNIYDLIKYANKKNEKDEVVSNIKVLNVPFTPFHMNNYLKKRYQDVCRKKFNIGKSELNVKLLYLNPEYILPKTNKSIYEILVESIYYEYFYEGDKERKKDYLVRLNKNIENDYNYLYKEVFAQKNKAQNVFEDDFDTSMIITESSIKKEIIKILKKDKISTRELAIINSVDIDRLMIKSTFIDILKNLSNPFLNKIVDTNKIHLLKNYLVTNYGENIESGISKDIIDLIEKKLNDFICSTNCFFIENFNQLVNKISEATGEKESIVENVILNSKIYQNFSFIRYLKGAKINKENLNESILKLISRSSVIISKEGEDEEKIIIPYIKIKEFLVYLISANIDFSWEKLTLLFDELLPIIKNSMYKVKKNNTEITMYQIGGNYNIIIKDKEIKEFQVRNVDEIEYLFQDFNLSDLKEIIIDLFQLIQKRGFGFENKKEFNELLKEYSIRNKQYFTLKAKSDRLLELIYSKNFFIAILKKLLFWFPLALLELKLHKISKKNELFSTKVSYYYLKEKEKEIVKTDDEFLKIKEKISNFIEFNKKVEETILSEKKEKRITLPELTDEEKELFNFLKKYLTLGKIIFFTHNPEIDEEKVVLYVKESDKKKLFENNNIKLNTIDEYSTRYFVIKSLIKKRYIIQKEYLNFSLERGKKTYTVHLSNLVV